MFSSQYSGLEDQKGDITITHKLEDKVLREVCEALISRGLSGVSEVSEK